MSGREERERAVELYFSTPMSTKQVVEHLGYPTRQCLERWLRDDPRYADAVPKPPIPLGTRCRAVELCLSGMQQKQVATELGVSAGAVHHWMRLYRAGGMAALEPKRRDAMPQAGTDSEPLGDDPDVLRRRIRELELENALMREAVRGRKKRPGRRPAAPVEPGEDNADRPAEAEVFAEVADMLAAVSRPAATTTTTRGSALTSTPGCAPAWRGRSPIPGAGTGTGGSRPRSGRVSRRR